MIFRFIVVYVIRRTIYMTHPNQLLKFTRGKKGSTGAIDAENLPKRKLDSRENDKTEKLNRNREDILETRISSVISISNSRDYGTNPIISEDNQVNVALADKIIIIQCPWKMITLKVNESFAPDVNK